MDQEQWESLNRIDKLKYALKNREQFNIVVDMDFIQLESISPIDVIDYYDYGIDDLLKALDIPYEEA